MAGTAGSGAIRETVGVIMTDRYTKLPLTIIAIMLAVRRLGLSDDFQYH